MIAKAIQGWRPGGLVAYLMGPGKYEEHQNPRVVASWDGAPSFHQPSKNGPGEFDFDLRDLIGQMQELPKEAGLPLANPAPPSPEGLPEAEVWMDWLRTSGRKRPPRSAPTWVRHYWWNPKAGPRDANDNPTGAVELKPGYVWHTPVRLHPTDRTLTDAEWERIAQRLMEATGIHQAGCRWIAVRHADDHIHLMATLVTAKGGKVRRFYPHQDHTRLREACQDLEREFNLFMTAGIDKTARVQPTRNEVGKAQRLGRSEPARTELHRLVSQAAATATGPQEFFARLEEFRVQYKLSLAADGAVRGCSYGFADDTTSQGQVVFFGGRELAADLSWPQLRARWDSAPEAEPVELTVDGRSTPAARLQVLDEAAAVVDSAAARVRAGQESPDGVAHAAGELLAALALGSEYRNGGSLTDAMSRYDRAARTPHEVLPHDFGPLARDLRRASRRLAAVGALSGRGNEKFAIAVLVLAIAGLIAEIRAHQEARSRLHQAAAAEAARAALPVDRNAAAHGRRLAAGRPASAVAQRTVSRVVDRSPRPSAPPNDPRRPGRRPPR